MLATPESMVAVLSVWPIRHLRLHGVIGGYRKLEELKGEFEYMKTRFSPQFVQRVDKSLT